MMFEARRAACEEKTGLAVFVGGDDEGNGGGPQAGIRLQLALEARQIRDDSRSKCGVEDMGSSAHGGRA